MSSDNSLNPSKIDSASAEEPPSILPTPFLAPEEEAKLAFEELGETEELKKHNLDALRQMISEAPEEDRIEDTSDDNLIRFLRGKKHNVEKVCTYVLYPVMRILFDKHILVLVCVILCKCSYSILHSISNNMGLICLLYNIMIAIIMLFVCCYHCFLDGGSSILVDLL